MDKKYLSKLVLPYSVPYINKSTEQYVILDGTYTTCQLCGYSYYKTLEGVSDHIRFHSALAVMAHKNNVYCQKALCLQAIENATYIMDNSEGIEDNVIAFGMLLYAKYSMYVIGNFALGATGSIVARERYYSEYIVCNEEYVPSVAKDIIHLIWCDDTAANKKAKYNYEFYNFSIAAFCDELVNSGKPKLVDMATEILSKIPDEDMQHEPIFNTKELETVRFRKPSDAEIEAYEMTSLSTYGASVHNKSHSKMVIGFDKKPETNGNEQDVKEDTTSKQEISRSEFQRTWLGRGLHDKENKKQDAMPKTANADAAKSLAVYNHSIKSSAVKPPVVYTGKAEAKLKEYIDGPKDGCDLKVILLDYVVELENRVIGYYGADITLDEQEELIEKIKKARMLMGKDSKPKIWELKGIL